MSLNLTQVGDIAVQQHHLARCHCGCVVFELYLPQGSLILDAVIVRCAVAEEQSLLQ